MFYNQYDNSNCCNHNEKDQPKKTRGYCTVKVIQECCYPSYWDYEENGISVDEIKELNIIENKCKELLRCNGFTRNIFKI